MRRSFHIVCIILTLGFIACAVFLFPNAPGRIIESGRDFGTSIAYYFCSLFGFDDAVMPTVNTLPDYNILMPAPSGQIPSTMVPETIEGMQTAFVTYWQTFITAENLVGYLSFLANGLNIFARVVILTIPVIVGLYILLRQSMHHENNDYNYDTKPLRIFKRISDVTYRPAKTWITGFVAFVREHRPYCIIWLITWAYAFNLITIALEAVAYYFYFACSFDVINLWRQVYKLFLDLSAVITFVPVPVWVLIGLAVFVIVRRKIGFRILNGMEWYDRDFIAELPICVMLCGTMGTGKTTMLTDMALSLEVMFRDKAYEIILRNDLKFPFFPWINFENELRENMESGEIKNLYTCRKYIDRQQQLWEDNNRAREYIYDYDYDRYDLEYNDNLVVKYVWSVLKEYAQAYLIYITRSSLLISNYAIRTDNVLADAGNFPLWNSDFFKSDPRLMDAQSRHSHILNFDALRLGKKLNTENEKTQAFEFGIINITEIGKERGNALLLNELKRLSDETNQKNDKFNDWLKLVRHLSTVGNYPFAVVYTDDQRPESWGADARDLCQLGHVRAKGDLRLAMPFFALEELVCEFVFSKFRKLYSEYRYSRGDNTLAMYVLKSIDAALDHYYNRTYNTFGYHRLTVEIENGTQDSGRTESHYNLMIKKIHANRFATDCYEELLADRVRDAGTGIDDMPEYANVHATTDELKGQDSYLIKDLSGIHDAEVRQRAETAIRSEIRAYVAALNDAQAEFTYRNNVRAAEYRDKILARWTEHPEEYAAKIHVNDPESKT